MNRLYIYIIIFCTSFGICTNLYIYLPGVYTNPCLTESDSASVKISVNSFTEVTGELIEYHVVDTLGDLVSQGVFSVSNEAIIYFDESGDYFIHASLGSIESDTLIFSVNQRIQDIELSTISEQYYLCSGQKEIDIEIINSDNYQNTNIIVNSENTYVGANGNFQSVSSTNFTTI